MRLFPMVLRGFLPIRTDFRVATGKEIARGLVNYSASETRQIMGTPSSEIEAILGYQADEELIHRDNLVLV